jgi:hypothetical protein
LEHLAELRKALESLLEELSHYDAKAEGAPPGPDAAPEADPEASMLRELSAYLAETRDDIGGILSSHPAATAGAAFLLGVAVGRLSR